MTLKSATLFALVGTTLLTFFVLLDFVRDLSSVLHGLIPAIRLLDALVYLVASLSVTVFFVVFRRTQ